MNRYNKEETSRPTITASSCADQIYYRDKRHADK